MPIKRPQFANQEVYHIIIRGIAGQKTFLEKKDYLRYLYSLREFNDEKTITIRDSSPMEVIPVKLSVEGFPKLIPTLANSTKIKNSLVEILVFCLMPNHIHLLVRQRKTGGISLFLQKMGGYSSYFNKKYQRFGSLFQRPFLKRSIFKIMINY
jgi:putative transposase